MFKGAKKEDLKVVAVEIGGDVSEEIKLVELKEIILQSKEYKNDPDFVKDILISTIEDRKAREERLKLEEQNKIEIEKIALEKVRLEREYELERARIQASSQNGTPVTSSDSNIEIGNETRIETLIKSIRTLTIPIPSKPEAWNLFFTSLERAFTTKKVSDEVKAEILLNLLGEKAGNILIYIKDEELTDYEKVKFLVLREFEPTPQICLENFRKAKRNLNETHVQFASRLATNWEYYCRLRKVNDFDTLNNLIVSDRLFQTLDQETASHVSVRQGEEWLKPTDLGKECDVYFVSKGKSLSENNYKPQNFRVNAEQTNCNSRYIPPPLRREENKNKFFKPRDKDCYICGDNHLAKDCPDRFNKKNFNHKNKEKSASQDNIRNNEVLVAEVKAKYFHSKSDIKVPPLQRVNIIIEGKEVEALIDSATQVMVLNSAYAPNIKNRGQGKIVLTSAFGKQVDAEMSSMAIALKDEFGNKITHPVETLVAVTSELRVPCLLPPSVYETLKSKNFEQYNENINNLCVKVEIESEVNNEVTNELKTSDNGKTVMGNAINILSNEHDSTIVDQVKDVTGEFSKASKVKHDKNKCETLEKELMIVKNNVEKLISTIVKMEKDLEKENNVKSLQDKLEENELSISTLFSENVEPKKNITKFGSYIEQCKMHEENPSSAVESENKLKEREQEIKVKELLIAQHELQISLLTEKLKKSEEENSSLKTQVAAVSGKYKLLGKEKEKHAENIDKSSGNIEAEHKKHQGILSNVQAEFTSESEEKEKTSRAKSEIKKDKKRLEEVQHSLLQERSAQEEPVKDRETHLAVSQAVVDRMQEEFPKHKQKLQEKLDVSRMELGAVTELKHKLEVQHSVCQELKGVQSGKKRKKRWPKQDFFYCPTEQELDLVQCYVCFKELDGWEANDEPWAEHFSHSKTCVFAKIRKPQKDLTISEIFEIESERKVNKIKKSCSLRNQAFRVRCDKMEAFVTEMFDEIKDSK